MRYLIVILVAAAALIGVVPASAHGLIAHHPRHAPLPQIERSQKTNLAYARYLCNHGRHATKAWGCTAVKWLTRELKQTEAALHPVVTSASVDSCLSELIKRESGWRVNATNPTTGAYGLPQALPGSKMASAGSDWATNPATQIRWMKGYVAHYGGSCAALAFQKRNGWY